MTRSARPISMSHSLPLALILYRQYEIRAWTNLTILCPIPNFLAGRYIAAFCHSKWHPFPVGTLGKNWLKIFTINGRTNVSLSSKESIEFQEASELIFPERQLTRRKTSQIKTSVFLKFLNSILVMIPFRRGSTLQIIWAQSDRKKNYITAERSKCMSKRLV